MKRALLAVSGAGLLASVSSSASADVSGLQVRMTDDAAEIVVLSDAKLGTPRVRSERGEVEVWFPDVHDNSRLGANGDGTAIYRARLRPGMGASAVLDIDVGGRRKVDTSLVTIDTQDGATVIRIPRSQLPSIAPASALQAEVVEQPAAPPPAAQVVPVAAPTPAPTVTAAAPVAAQEQKIAGNTLGTKPGKPGASDKPAKTENDKLAQLASGGESKLPTLIWMTLVLGAVLGAIKLWQRKSTALLTQPDIEVVASKRLGPGLQLYIVRAFGQEHLLSVNGKSTERIATNESFDDLDAAAASIRPSFALPNEPGVQLTPSRSVLSNTAAPARSQASELSTYNRNGAEMLSGPLPPMPMPAPSISPLSRAISTGGPRTTPISTSQSIAGLIRLREQMDRVN